jgi:anaerobic ribonucleoside-triphosphate reductase activating protein
MSETLTLYARLPRTRALGPCTRFALWVQGCPFHCPGCMTPDARPFAGGETVAIDRLAA